MPTTYGSLNAANTYFTTRLHSNLWFNETSTERANALYKATSILEMLNYKGCKATVYTALEADSEATQATLRAAEAAQELEFPRDMDTSVPTTIEYATYEIAFALLDGIDPDLELENLAVVSQGYAGVKTTYNRGQQPIEHLINGVPSATAWRMLRPFLRSDGGPKLSRV